MKDSNNNIFTWKIGGIAGGGQQIAGLIFTKACVRGGLFTFDSSEYPSRIRGGLVTYRVSVGQEPVMAIYQKTQLLIALNREAFDYCLPDMMSDGVILYDSDKFEIKPGETKGVKVYPLPLEKLASQAQIKPIAANIIITGASAALLDFNLEILNEVIKDAFAGKGEEVVAMNITAAKFGYDYAKANLEAEKFPYKLKAVGKNKDSIIVTSNDTACLGAVAADCKFFASYPMTPASSILHNLAAWQQKTGMVVKHPEDEISAIHMAIGANFAGVRAATATSGGGFALMTEALALAGITETPVVIFESQRPGPATGLPTWTEQGDLAYLAHAGHGEFVRVILAPGDPIEAFYLTTQAFNIAEKWQIPVFILLDKYISEGHQSILPPDLAKVEIDRGQLLTDEQLNKMAEFKRYLVTKSGVSPRSIPGQKGGVYLANSDEHDELGFTIEGFTPQIRNQMVEKRSAKLGGVLKDLPAPELFGPKSAKLTLIGWGSVKGPVLEALKVLADVNYLHLVAPWPLGVEKLQKALKGVKKLVCIENNYDGQLANILQEVAGIKVDQRLNKYNGAQFFPEEVVELIKNLK
ncbi:MAG: 2-oxoacid:acceptor oxidoreductase subunit alpha [Patescibacteria group bacterium]|jgi:2-oxoglutarate ferredoxin oxidoreductase subunit alpha